MKRIILIVVALLLIVASFALADGDPTISFAEDSYTVATGKNLTLRATVMPKSKMNLEWSSSDETVATVSMKGQVKGISAGEAKITVCSADNPEIKASCKVTVVVPVKKIALSEKKIALAPDTYWKVNCVFEPADATNQKVSWSSSNNNVAQVDDNGVVFGIAKGNAKVTATSQDGNKKAVVNVQVGEYDVVITTASGIQVKRLENSEVNSVNGCVRYEDDGWLIPVRAGEDIVLYKHIISDEIKAYSAAVFGKHDDSPTEMTVYVAQSVFPVKESMTEKKEQKADSDSNITFRGIPWGSSMDEALDKLNESAAWVKVLSDDKTSQKQFANWTERSKVIEVRVQIPGLQVAGFPAEEDNDGANIVLYFMPDLAGNQTSYSQNSGKLVAAEYYCIGSLKDQSWSETETEIKKKLSTLYGECEEDKWQKDNASVEMIEITHSEKTLTLQAMDRRLKNPIGFEAKESDYIYGMATSGYCLNYSYWSDGIREHAEIINMIDKRAEEIAQEKQEQEKLEEERREQEKKDAEEEARGYDGL